MKLSSTMLVVILVVLSPLAGAEHDDTRLEYIRVTADQRDSLIQPDDERARELLEQVPGNTVLIPDELFRRGRAGSVETILDHAASVYSQSRFGGSENRLSIRGSGLTQTFESRGVRLLRNGLPLTEADGFTRNQLVDPLIVRRAEVYPGANALEFGAATLGGAVNLITHNGLSHPHATLRAEAGSDGWRRAQLAKGGSSAGETVDYFVSVTGLQQDGFRRANDEEASVTVYANLGFRPSPGSEHRLHLTYQQQNLDLPGSLTQSRIDEDPEQANTLWRRSRALRDFDPIARLDWQSALRFDPATSLSVGASWQRLEMFHALPSFQFAPGTPDSQILELERDDAAVHARLSAEREWLGIAHEVTAGARFAYGEDKTRYFTSAFDTLAKDALARIEEGRARNAELFVEDRLLLGDHWRLVLGAQWLRAWREVDTEQVDAARPLGGGVDAEDRYSHVNPKLGAIYRWSDEGQWFANLSRSFEPPTLGELANPATGETLDGQRGTTLEIGSRGRRAGLSWQVAAYYAELRDEILIVETPPGTGNFDTSNAEDTVHAGVEISLTHDTTLPWARADHLVTTVNYTYNRFRFDDDPVFGDNALPGLPEQILRAEVVYRHRSGFYAGPAIEATAGTAYVDFANTLQNDDYFTLNFRAGYEHGEAWSVFVEAENLHDRHYASNTGVIADASASFGEPSVFNPGRTRSVFAGVEVTF